MNNSDDSREKSIVNISVGGMIVNIVLAAVKFILGQLSGSVAISSDAVNSITDSSSSLITIIGTKLAQKKPYKKHPFGYGRIEYFASLIIGVNSIIVFDRHGEKCLHYSKVHICDFGDEIMLVRGSGFCVSELDTRLGIIKIGSMIRYDREFPESARILMLEGAELIFAPNVCPMEINRLCALRTRAYENMLAVATCNYPAGMHDCNGHSTLFDGVPWLSDEPGVRDMLVKDCGENEGVYIAEFDVDMLREYWQTE